MRKFQLEEELNTDADNESSDDAKAEVIVAASPNKKMTFRDKVLLEPKYEFLKFFILFLFYEY